MISIWFKFVTFCTYLTVIKIRYVLSTKFFVIDVLEIYYIVLLSHTEQNKLRFYHQVFDINILLLSHSCQSNLRYFLSIKFLISMYLKYFPFYSYLTLINTSWVLSWSYCIDINLFSVYYILLLSHTFQITYVFINHINVLEDHYIIVLS